MQLYAVKILKLVFLIHLKLFSAVYIWQKGTLPLPHSTSGRSWVLVWFTDEATNLARCFSSSRSAYKVTLLVLRPFEVWLVHDKHVLPAWHWYITVVCKNHRTSNASVLCLEVAAFCCFINAKALLAYVDGVVNAKRVIKRGPQQL